ncbi:MAG: hypothetical protein ACREBU_15215 [Nitrososphaera sp.]
MLWLDTCRCKSPVIVSPGWSALHGIAPWLPMTPDGKSDTDLEQEWRERVKYNENEDDDYAD